ncbi:MAG TPA: hypothetical protein VLA43_04095, partial [Longimicrobiales bacterium]|nr:hypothetical protein [Longimicrobiales bacterium]
RQVAGPWVSLRLTGAAGWSELVGRPLPTGWEGDADPGFRTSFGGGMDLFWNVIQLDLARGIPDGEWSFFVSITRRFHPWL